MVKPEHKNLKVFGLDKTKKNIDKILYREKIRNSIKPARIYHKIKKIAKTTKKVNNFCAKAFYKYLKSTQHEMQEGYWEKKMRKKKEATTKS